MRYATCCEQGSQHIIFVVFGVGDSGWGMTQHEHEFDPHLHYYRVGFCPFCGANLNPLTLEQALRLLAESEEPLTICFDVDGVLCDDRTPCDGPNSRPIPYDERRPYPWVSDVLKTLRAHGHTIHIQTARYMEKCDGDQLQAMRAGEVELWRWLKFYDIPFDRAYLGKASAHIYADDRACLVASNRGSIEWSNTLLPRIAAIQAHRSQRRANVRVQV